MKNEPVLDFPRALEELAGDRDIFQEVASVYLEEVPAQIEKIGHALESGKNDVAARLVHSLKSSSRTVGGMRLGALAAAFEEKLSMKIQAAGIIDLLYEEFALLREALRQNGLKSPE